MKKIIVPLLILILGTPLSATDDWIKLSFVGDIIMHGPVRSCALRNNIKDKKTKSLNNGGFDYLLQKVRYCFKKSDITVGNMEFPVAPPFRSKGMVFNSGPKIISALKDANFSVLTIANNHILDQGYKGIHQTIRYLKHYGMPFVGVHGEKNLARKGLLLKRKGVTIGIIAYTGVLNNPFPGSKSGLYINDFYIKSLVAGDIIRIRSRCDFLVMVAHFGVEYDLNPQKKDVSYAKYYCDKGVDLLIGHHPHLIQPQLIYKAKDGRTCRIFFSLGNFISNQTWGHLSGIKKNPFITPQESVIVNCYIKGNKNNIKTKYTVIPIYTRNIHDKRMKQNYYRDIQTIVIRNEIDLLHLKKLPGYKNKILILKKKLKSIDRVLFRIPVKNQQK